MAALSTDRAHGPLRVLVVDDNSINRTFLRSALPGNRFQVDEADSGDAAIEGCRRVEYDLILLDLHMPGRDGLATANAIRQLETPAGSAAVIFLTADTRGAVRDRLEDSGFSYVLNKPLSIGALLKGLNDWGLVDLDIDTSPHDGRSDRLIDHQSALEICNGQVDLVARMQTMLRDELKLRLERLDRKMNEGAWSDAAALLHQWMGASAYAGASQLADRSALLHSTLTRSETDDAGDEALADAYLKFLRCAHATIAALAASGPAEADSS